MLKAHLKDTVITLCLALAILLGLQLLLQQVIVNQTSMMPNLEDGERVYINKVTYFFHTPERGDIIVFKPPAHPGDTPLIKRVIGLPGETIQVKSGQVYINGEPLEEPYIKDRPGYTMQPITVPTQHYFVLGDNRNNSRDSHEGWTVPEDNIVGKAWISIWPPGKWGLAPNYAYASK